MKSLFGYGNTTKAIAKTGNWQIFDDKFKEVSKDEFGNTLLPSENFNPKTSSLEITSPGISPTNPLIQKAQNLMSDYDYFYPFPFSIWITGSNGKTTTTEMIKHLLDDSDMGGNIGKALANMDKSKKFWILETSSFTLHYTKIAKPNIFILLPITPDHISWHGSFAEYKKAKLSPLDRMTERDIAIIPDEFKDYQTNAYKITYQNSEDLIKYFEFKDIIFQEPFKLDEILAKAVYKILYFEEKSLQNFKIDPHKIEEFYDNKNRLWVDDSKATNIDATIQALKRYKNKNIYLILGGDSKSQNLIPLFDELKHYKLKLFLIGKDAPIFENLSKKYKLNYKVCHSLETAISEINNSFNDGVAILSPASASLDQFTSYKDRGEKFKEIIRSYNGN